MFANYLRDIRKTDCLLYGFSVNYSMIASTDLQADFFTRLKSYIPPHVSLVEELVSLLHLSHDSVYRRLRGEKYITLEEIKLICDHFHVSLDELLNLKGNAVVFFRNEEKDSDQPFVDYLQGILRQMKYFNSFPNRTMYYLCKDSPIFHFFIFPEIAAFKTFFWIRSVLNQPEYLQEKFDLEKHSFHECYLLGQEIIKEYNCIPSIEMWNYESFNSTINQIEFYRDAGLFRSAEDLKLVCQSLIRVFDYLESLALSGIKSSNGKPGKSIQLYINEVILGSNTILLHLDNQRISILTYSVLKFLMSHDQQFCEDSFASFNNLKDKSILITGAGEKERSRYFNVLRNKVLAIEKG
jgi:hypothetical protein